jgi:CheY-like chemotaxis protein
MPGPSGNSQALHGPQAVPGFECGQFAEGLAPADELAKRQARLEEAAAVAHRLAHDFGNVLTGILGFSDLSLSLLGPDSPIRPYVAEIHQAARRGAELTQALRWFGRRGSADGETSSLAEAVAREYERFRKACAPSVEVRADVSDALPPLAVDGESLRQALRQVLENARDALPTGGVIVLAARTRDLIESDCRQLLGDPRPGPFVEVQVADSGSGFSSEALDRLFVEPFFSTKPRRGGLGLAIVYGILRSRRGGLALGNGLQDGGVVRLYFPVAAKPVALQEAGHPTAAVAADRVLVVDDDPMVLQVVCATLQRAGYGVQVAASGAEALTHYAVTGNEKFDLVLADVLMPRMSGIDLARRLLDRDADVNVLFMSGQVAADFPETDFPRGRFDLLSKPFRPDGLLRAVRSALDRRPRRPLAAPSGAGPLPRQVPF